jgi:hypothetical protein
LLASVKSLYYVAWIVFVGDWNKMKGAIVFLVVFALVLFVTVGYTSLPPGKMIYNAVLQNTEQYTSTYMVAGAVNAFSLIIGVFNGVIYGFIAWLIFTLATMGNKKDKNVHQTTVVNVNLGDKKDTATVTN